MLSIEMNAQAEAALNALPGYTWEIMTGEGSDDADMIGKTWLGLNHKLTTTRV